jgi:hypothetical protein
MRIPQAEVVCTNYLVDNCRISVSIVPEFGLFVPFVRRLPDDIRR